MIPSSASPNAAAPTARRQLVVGSRGSALALAQTALVCDALRDAHPAIAIGVERITTTGDVRSDVPLSELGRGVFVKEIESALLENRIDVAVHSAKDLPSTLPRGLTLGAILPRADARDVLVSPFGTLRELPAGARVGTSSPRRVCQLRALRPDVETVDVRGNVDTRLRKLARGEFDAIVLAAAGLLRLGRASDITEWLDVDTFIPSVGQGALAVEVRANDHATLQLVRALDDPTTRAAVLAERAFLAELGAGCRAAAGAYARVSDSGAELRIAAFLGAADGEQVRATRERPVARAEALGVEVAHELLRNGGARFLVDHASALAGKVVVITRPAERSTELIALLRVHGALPVVCPTIAMQPVTDLSDLDRSVFGKQPPRWVAFTSVNAVRAVADRLRTMGQALPGAIGLCAVGNATARAVENRFRPADFISSTATAEALGAELPDVQGARVLFPRGDLAAETLTTGLTARGASVTEIVVYRTTPGPGVDDLRGRTNAGDVDAIVFASPSSVRFAAKAVDAIRSAPDGGPVVLCIGPTTAQAARDLGLDAVEAASTSVGGIVESLERSLATRVAESAVSPVRSQ